VCEDGGRKQRKETEMKLIGVLVVLAGWLLPIVALTLTQSLTARFILALLGIAITLVGIIGVLNKAHLKDAIWKT
jgi:hypothetical protein